MAGVNGIKAMFGMDEVNDVFNEFQQNVEKKQLEALQYAGEEFADRAKDLRTYKDRTNNLRSSIGYVILKDGQAITEVFKEDKGKEGVETGKKIIREVALQHPFGFVLIGVAGMNYAAAVESYEYDVITGPAEECVKLLKEIIDEIKS